MNFKEYQEQAAQTALYPEEIKLLYLALKLCGEAGEVAEHIAKVYRDDRGTVTLDRWAKLEKELGDVLWYWSELCRQLKLDPDRVAQTNLDKLASRMERGTIHGDGSDR